MLRLLLVLGLVSVVPFGSRAAHLVGGEIYYTCLGGNQYEITLKIYRDCYTVEGAQYDNPAYIGVYDNAGNLLEQLQAQFNGSQQLEVVIDNPCLQAPPDVCVEEAIYRVTTTLPFISGGYHIAYQRCCRNPTIVNLLYPDEQGSTYYVSVPEKALNTCNSSPSFKSFPPLALCIGDLLEFDHSATDADGDQLVYSLCTPYHGGDQLDPQPIPPLGPPYNFVSWAGGYDASNPMDGLPQLSIDQNTGLLSCIPNQAGQYVVGVCVEEYRNGDLISSNVRDFQFNVVNCTSSILAVIPSQANFHDPCDGLEVDFGNESVNSQFYHWDFGIDNLADDTSNLENPSYTFPDTGRYSVILVANPGYPCADTTVDEILVYTDVRVEIEWEGNQCSDASSIDFTPTGDFGSGATFVWEFENGAPSTSTEMAPSGVSFDSVGIHDVTVTVMEFVCSDESQAEVEVYARPSAYFNIDTLMGCPPLGVVFIDSSLAATPHSSYWDFGDGFSEPGNRVFHGFSEPGSYDVSLSVWTETGCVDTSTLIVESAIIVWSKPSADLVAEPDTQFIYDPVFTFTGNSNSETCELFLGDGNSYLDEVPNCTFEHFYRDTGNFLVMMEFTDANGCSNTDSVWVRVEPEVRFWVPNAFTPDGDMTNDTWGPKAFGFSEYEIWVFDRWGNLMFYSTDPFERWNGCLNNQSNHEPVYGVYAYRILARSVKSTVVREFGHVTILK